jgi:replicative DNA helicase
MENGYIQRKIDEAARTNFASDDSEKSLLGCIIGNFDRCTDIAAQVVEDDFYYDAHRAIFKAIMMAKAEQLKVDLVTVDQMLQKVAHNPNSVSAVMVDCARTFVTSVHAESYMKIVKELATRRKAIALVGEIQKELTDPAQGINSVMDKLRTESGDLFFGKHSWVTMREVMLNTYEYLERRVKGDIPSITTGIPNVDAVIGGFFGGEMTIIGARPAVGKSAFGMNVAIAAAQQGFKVGILSREMTDIQFGQRILSTHGIWGGGGGGGGGHLYGPYETRKDSPKRLGAG